MANPHGSQNWSGKMNNCTTLIQFPDGATNVSRAPHHPVVSSPDLWSQPGEIGRGPGSYSVLHLLCLLYFLSVLFFGDGAHTVQAGSNSLCLPRMTLNPCSFCLHISSARIADMVFFGGWGEGMVRNPK